MTFPAVLLALAAMAFLAWSVLRRDVGTQEMAGLSGRIQKGAATFLRLEYRAVAWVVAVIALLFVLGPLWGDSRRLGWQSAVAFVAGTFCAALAGYIAMSVATRANARTAHAAGQGRGPAMRTAFSAGGVTGLAVTSVALLGLLGVHALFGGTQGTLNGYAMGASLMALFARSGGGIFTKAADMGSDLAGKIEEGIPEDDPRNAAVVADNVGDNVGDIAGLGTDLLESYVEAIVVSVVIGTVVANAAGNALAVLPFALAGWGAIASLAGVGWIVYGPGTRPRRRLNLGIGLASVLMLAGAFVIVQLLGPAYAHYAPEGAFWALAAGLATGLLISASCQYYGSARYAPVRRIAEAARSGPATVVVAGLATGMLSSLVPALAVAVAALFAHWVFGVCGVALGALGMLSTLGVVLAVDSYGPVADNAGGIAKMADLSDGVREVTDELDSVGNTTAAIGKGFAIGSAAFAALALVTAYVITLPGGKGAEYDLSLSNPRVLTGLIVGGMVPFVFSALLARGVDRTAHGIIEEVRRQFREISGLREGRTEPDSDRCVRIATRGALRHMRAPGMLGVLVPVVTGFVLGPAAVGGLLIGALITGFPLAVHMATSGAAFDNAKKHIEEGHMGGQGSDPHKAAVIGDTVGDPLKDTMGPSINILIKLMAVTALVLGPLFTT